MRCLTIIFCAVLLLLSLHQAQAKIIHVPADSSTIQGGINGAVNGDTVLVAPGTYYEHINFNGKAILVTSESGPQNTTMSRLVDASPIVTFSSGEDTTSILDGFCVSDATGDNAILCSHSSPKIVNNRLTSNLVYTTIRCEGTHAVIVSNEISLSSTVGMWSSNYDSAYIAFNLIANNANFGIDAYNNSYAIIVNNTLNNNDQANIFCRGSPIIKNNIITNGPRWGIKCEAGAPDISYNDVWNNNEEDYSGCSPGIGDISADPLFCEPENNNYYLHSSSPCRGSGEGGVDMGAFDVGCGGPIVTPGPDQVGRASSQVSVFFYIENELSFTDTFDLDISDSLAWNIDPTNYEITLDSGEVDTVYFTVSIPIVPVGTVDKLKLTAVSHTDSSLADSAYLLVTCDAPPVEVTAGSDQSGYPDSIVSVAFLIQNLGMVPDSYSVDISDTLGWDIVPPHYDIILDTAQIDSVSFTVSIPYVPLGTIDELTLLVVSKTNPIARDSASLTVTCDAYVEGLEISPADSVDGQANSLVSARFHIQNTGLAPDSFSLTVSDSLGWDIQPPSYQVTLDPGQQDSVFFDVVIPNVPVGTTDWVILSGVSLTNPFVTDSAFVKVTCASRIIYVPADFSTIQAAIDFSSDWDSILVAPETYYEHIFFNGKAIVLKSEKGRDSTIISKIAGGVSMVSFTDGEDSNSVLAGFTITGAFLESGQGAGIRCQNASPKILNNRIVNNTCPYGAGIDCDDQSNPLIAYNIIEENTATSQGGGVRITDSSSPMLLKNTIIGNSAVDSGAGILCLNNSSPTITGNLIALNTTPAGYGGGIAVSNCSIVNITNNTLDRNSATYGGGIYIDNTPSATIVNTIVTNSVAGKGIRATGPFPTIIYCDVWNNSDENYYGCLPGEGCISADPIFCDPENGDYYLWITSPCIGAGQDGADIGALGIGCEVVGDANADGVINSADVVYLIDYLFKGGPPPEPLEAGDVNCDQIINSADVVYLINYLFKGGPPPGC